MANGEGARLTRVFPIEGLMGSNLVNFKAVYMPSLACDMIIGMDTIADLKLVTFDREILLGETEMDTQQRYPVTVIEPETGGVLRSLTPDEEGKLDRFLGKELEIMECVPGRTNLVQHTIKLKGGIEPIKQRYYNRNPAMQQIINDELETMLGDGVVEPSKSPWSSPVVLVKKPSGKYRFCIDFRKLNSSTEKDAYPLPHINAILENLRGAKYISTIDLKQGYWQVPLSPSSRPLTAFTVPGKGLYQFSVLPFGLHSAGATFQRLLDGVIGPELEPRAFAYLDDLILVSSSFEEHLELLKDVFERLRKAGLQINVEKCQFCRKELRYLGHMLDERGIRTDLEKVTAIVEFARPTNVKTLRSFLGVASWYRRFIAGFAKLSTALTKLLRKTSKWEWNEEQENAFNVLKQRLSTAPILACPDFTKRFVVQTDASGEGLGASLTQCQDGKEVVIAFASRSLSDNEKKFTVTEQECLALVWAVKKFRPYLEGYRFTAVTDQQALKWLMQLAQPSGRLAR